MCDIVFVDGVECDTRADLEAAIGCKAVAVEPWRDEDWKADSCMCPCDYEATCERAGFVADFSDPMFVVLTKKAD